MKNNFVLRGVEKLQYALTREIINSEKYIYAFKSSIIGSLIYAVVIILASTYFMSGVAPSSHSNSPVWDMLVGWYGALAFWSVILSPLWLLIVFMATWAFAKRNNINRNNFYFNICALPIFVIIIVSLSAIVYFFSFITVAILGSIYNLEIHTI